MDVRDTTYDVLNHVRSLSQSAMYAGIAYLAFHLAGVM